MHHYERHTLDWQGVLIQVRFCPNWSAAFQTTFGRDIAHLEIEALEPAHVALPITSTGYRSVFVSLEDITEAGGPLAFVLDILEDAAADPAWKAQEEAARQYSLF